MMPSKIGLSFQAPLDYIRLQKLAQSAPWAGWKSVDNTLPLTVAAVARIPVRVLRLATADALSPGDAAAAFLRKDLSAVTHIQLANESDRCGDFDWQSEVATAIVAGGYRSGFLGMGWSTGNPARVEYPAGHVGPHFPEWVTGPMTNIMSTCGKWSTDCRTQNAVVLNQYFNHKLGDDAWADDVRWSARRHALVRACLEQHGLKMPGVCVGESGREPGGWRSSMTPDEMFAAMVDVDAEDQTDLGLLVRCYFTLSPYGQWANYDYTELLDRLAAYVVSCRYIPKSSAPDVPASVIQKAMLSVVPATVVGRKPSMPVAPIDFRQDIGSYDCWVENIRRFFSRYSLLFDIDTVFQAGKGYPHPAGGAPATFAEFLLAVKELARRSNILVDVANTPAPGTTVLQVMEIDDFNTLWAALDDSDVANPWTVTVGEDNGDLNAGENWQHFGSLLQDTDHSDTIHWYDPAVLWDGDATHYSKAQFTAAIKANWDPKIIGYALKVKVV